MHDGHSHNNSSPAGKAPALLAYMADHNRHHAEELRSLSHNLKHQGFSEAARLIDEAEAYLSKCTGLLYDALSKLEPAGN